MTFRANSIANSLVVSAMVILLVLKGAEVFATIGERQTHQREMVSILWARLKMWSGDLVVEGPDRGPSS